ncbi:hypothetical protein A9W96_26260 [Mycobacterium sp. 1245852.3]|nr:hypothetical protein A9W96_26260 [Mycobacterium sp. 1245852.3]
MHTHPNQVDYAAHHVTRPQLIRALVDVGGLSVSATSNLLAIFDTADIDVWESVGKSQYAVSSSRTSSVVTADTVAEQTVDALLHKRDWRIRADSPAHRHLLDVCAALQALGHDDIITALDDYATAIEKVVEIGMPLIEAHRDLGGVIEKVIVGTRLGGRRYLGAPSTRPETPIAPTAD